MILRPLTLAIALGLAAAPAADVARTCLAPPTPLCSCCGPAGSAAGCDMACSPDDAPDTAASPVLRQPSTLSPSKALAAAWVVTEDPQYLTSRVGPSALGATPAPPPKRYLLACILRL
ncbi:MAG: hypothetical protein Q8R91_04815 [Candidatus Omnitrophota bacterium]|nr:hypothetical protein [Candidatus Omnitrophota bacterium]